MPCVRYIFVCEGESEWAYLRRLQSFLDQQPVTAGHFETPLRLIAPGNAVAKGGSFKTLARQFRGVRRENKRSDIKVWADFDLYHRNNNSCADLYRGKTAGIPDFHFSFHNFEDFYALHLDEPQHQAWLAFGQQGHFVQPLHSEGHFPAFTQIAVGYAERCHPARFHQLGIAREFKTQQGESAYVQSAKPRGHPVFRGVPGRCDRSGLPWTVAALAAGARRAFLIPFRMVANHGMLLDAPLLADVKNWDEILRGGKALEEGAVDPKQLPRKFEVIKWLPES